MSGKDEKPPAPGDHSHPYEVAPGLYISGHPDHSNDFLSRGIDAVVDLEGEVDTSLPQGEGQSSTTLYLYWPIEDGDMPDASTVRSIASLMARLIAEENKVLVHCRSGHNRSGLICARTLIEQGMSPRDAIDAVRAKRGDGHALDNENFVEWLLKEDKGS
jgi:protein-tyrosine phosphatase